MANPLDHDRRAAGASSRIIFVVALTAAVVVGFSGPFIFAKLNGTAHAQASNAGPISVCSGGDRAARQVTCVVDGDTGWQDGVKWRALDVDTPEISHAECDRERMLGERARDRLRELMADGYIIEPSGANGYYGRELVVVRLADGRDAGQVLIEEGLSQAWPNEGNIWCGS